MNILLINHYAGSLQMGMEYRPYYLSKEWIKMGHNVTIICSSFAHVRTFQPEIKSDFEEKIVEGIHYIFIKTPEYQGNGIRRVKNIFTFVLKLLFHSKRISKKLNPDIVIASSTYPLDIFPSRKIAKYSKAKLVFEVHDLWPLSPMELGGMSKYNPFIMLLQWAENKAYKYSNHVISMLPKTMEHMKSHGLDLKKWHYIPNGIDLSANEMIEINPELKIKLTNWKKDNYFLVGYTGGLGISNALEFLIDTANILKNNKIKILLFGKGPERTILELKIKTLQLDNIEFMGSVPKNSISNLLKEMDILYLGWRKNPLYRFGISPNKLMDYMLSGKPVIHSVTAGNDLVSESGCGISVPAENSNKIAEAILELLNLNAIDRNKMGQKGKDFVIQKHDYSILAQEFLSCIQ